MTCPTCNGRRRVEADHWDLNDPDNHLGWVPCPACGGTDIDVADLAAVRRERAAEIEESMSRHPAGRRPRRMFRKPGTPDPGQNPSC